MSKCILLPMLFNAISLIIIGSYVWTIYFTYFFSLKSFSTIVKVFANMLEVSNNFQKTVKNVKSIHDSIEREAILKNQKFIISVIMCYNYNWKL